LANCEDFYKDWENIFHKGHELIFSWGHFVEDIDVKKIKGNKRIEGKINKYMII